MITISPAVADIVNGSFEIVGGVLTWSNVRAYQRSRHVSGIYWPSTLFFSIWGFWNLFYYPALGQWMSFIGGIFITSGSTVWVAWVFWDQLKGRKGNPNEKPSVPMDPHAPFPPGHNGVKH